MWESKKGVIRRLNTGFGGRIYSRTKVGKRMKHEIQVLDCRLLRSSNGTLNI